MTEYSIVLIESMNGRTRSKKRLFKKRVILNLKTNGIVLSFYSNATRELMFKVLDKLLDFRVFIVCGKNETR